MSHTTLAELARRWKVDPATAKKALQRAGIEACEFYASPRYAWSEVLSQIEGWPEHMISMIDRSEMLRSATELADRMDVTRQTIRNYGRAGRLHEVRLGHKTVRYASACLLKSESEAKTAACGKE